MSKILTDNQYYSQIADVIREQNGTNNTYTPPQMVSALKDLFYEEVEGVPPISFNGIGENLLDYRIYGASGGVGDKTSNLAKWDTHLLPQINGIVVNDINSISSIIDVTSINNIYLYGDRTKLNSNAYRIGKSNEPISLNSQTTRITYGEGILDTSDCNYVIVSCSIANTGTTFDDIKNSFMIVEGSSKPSVFEPYGYKVPVVVNGKNLLDEANAVVTNYYITNAGQEAVGANGDKFLKSYINVKPSTEYTFKWSQTIMGSANNTPCIRISEYTSNNTFIQRVLCQCSAQSQNNYTFTTSNNTVYIDIRIDSETSTRGQHITEVMLVKGATAPDTYEEYTATTTNIYLNEPILENESISLSDTNVNIPTIRGTNVLTVDTTVQPSNVYVKARKESQYETAMRERYEEAQAQLDALESERE